MVCRHSGVQGQQGRRLQTQELSDRGGSGSTKQHCSFLGLLAAFAQRSRVGRRLVPTLLCKLAHRQASHGARTAYLALRFGVVLCMLFLTFAGAMSGGPQFVGCGLCPALGDQPQVAVSCGSPRWTVDRIEGPSSAPVQGRRGPPRGHRDYHVPHPINEAMADVGWLMRDTTGIPCLARPCRPVSRPRRDAQSGALQPRSPIRQAQLAQW